MNRSVVFATGVLTLGLLASCGGERVQSGRPAATDPGPIVKTSSDPAGPEMSVTSSCENDFPLVIDPSTMSVIATAQVSNDGDEPGKARVRAQWFPVGSKPIEAQKVVRIPAGETVRVPFRVKPDRSSLNGMVGLQHGDEMCRVDVELVH